MKMSPLFKHRSLALDTMRKAHYKFSPIVNLYTFGPAVK